MNTSDHAASGERTTESGALRTERAARKAARGLIIAIDGPSGAGKGTISREVASRLAYQHIDTGAMYRAVAWKALHDGIDLDDQAAVVRMADKTEFEIAAGVVRVDGHDVAAAIRTPEIDRAAAAVARLPQVREVLIARQRALGADGGVVMEGRDIGTVVFPDADVKIFLDASPEERARRRANDPAHTASRTAALEDIASALQARDHSDRTRAASPLTLAADAVVVDTTGISIQDAVDRVMAEIARRRA